MDIWAVCKHDHGLTWTEFQDMTLAEFEALEARRMIAVRHARFNAALIASHLYNANRGADTDAVSPFDYLPGYERSEEDIEAEKTRKSVKHAISVAFSERGFATPEAAQAEKARMILRMRATGVEDAEQLFREVFPDL
jgi:hypothetical protein